MSKRPPASSSQAHPAPPVAPDIFGNSLAVAPKIAETALQVGPTKLYELLADGELESFTLGRSRRITVASIRALVARRIAAAKAASAEADIAEEGTPAPGNESPPDAPRRRVRRRDAHVDSSSPSTTDAAAGRPEAA